MKFLSSVFVFLAFLPVSAGDTPEATIDEFFNIEKAFEREYKDWGAFGNDMDAYRRNYESILSRLYRKTMSGKLLESFLENMKEIHLNSGAGTYLFPQELENLSVENISQDENSAVMECSATKESVWSTMEDFALGNGDQLKRMYKNYNIVNPPYQQVFKELKYCKGEKIMINGKFAGWFNDYDIYVTSPVAITFYFKRTSSGWRICDIKEDYSGSTLRWESASHD